jgi:hypothetical protein
MIIEAKSLDDTRITKGPDKVTRGEVNGSQSKFLSGTWSISQNQPDVVLF